MMKRVIYISAILFAGLLSSCEKTEIQEKPEKQEIQEGDLATIFYPGDEFPIRIVTNKTLYSKSEDIGIKITNECDSIARYYHCSSYKGISPTVNTLRNGEWVLYWASWCNGYSSICCPQLMGHETYKDIIVMDLVPGYYRFEYHFIVRPSHEYKSFYSNSFYVK